jgi:hypothetical protein
MPARRATVVAAIMRVTWQAWFNDLTRSIGSRSGARALGGAVLLLLAAWLVLGTYALGSQLSLQEGDTATIAVPVAAVTFTLPALATLLCALYTPSRTVLNDTLAVLPIRAADRHAAIRWLSVGLGLALGGVWVAPLAVQFIAAGSAAESIGALLVCACLAAAGALTAHVIFLALQLVLNRLVGGGDVMTMGIAGLVTSLLLLWAMLEALPFQGGTGGGPFALAGRPLRAVTEDGGLDALRDGALLVLAVALLVAALSVLDRVPRRPGAALDLRLPRSVRAPRSLISIEARQWLRWPTNAVMLIFTAGLSVASLTLWRGSLEDDNWLLGAFFLFSLISTVGVGSFGPTRPFHWIYHVTGRPLAWVAPKLLSVLAIWLGLLCLYGAVLVLVTSWSPTEGVQLLPMLAVEVAAGCVIGLLLPVSREQSLSGALSESVAILVVLSIAIGLQTLPWIDTTFVYLATCAVAAAALVCTYIALARANVRETRRAGLG